MYLTAVRPLNFNDLFQILKLNFMQLNILGAKFTSYFWMNGLEARRTILEVCVGFFSARLSKVNDTGCWLLFVSIIGSIKTYFVVMYSHRNDIGLLDYGTVV